jgi:hypothetical protein
MRRQPVQLAWRGGANGTGRIPGKKGGAVAKHILIEAFHLTVYTPRGLSAQEGDAMRQVLEGPTSTPGYAEPSAASPAGTRPAARRRGVYRGEPVVPTCQTPASLREGHDGTSQSGVPQGSITCWPPEDAALDCRPDAFPGKVILCLSFGGAAAAVPPCGSHLYPNPGAWPWRKPSALAARTSFKGRPGSPRARRAVPRSRPEEAEGRPRKGG